MGNRPLRQPDRSQHCVGGRSPGLAAGSGDAWLRDTGVLRAVFSTGVAAAPVAVLRAVLQLGLELVRRRLVTITPARRLSVVMHCTPATRQLRHEGCPSSHRVFLWRQKLHAYESRLRLCSMGLPRSVIGTLHTMSPALSSRDLES